MAKNYYEVLEVPRGASADEIRKSYRRLARKFHPDVNPGNKTAESRFKEISTAYDVLSSPEKRKLYDEFGEDAAKIGFDPEKARAYKQWRQERPEQPSGFGFGGIDLDEFLAQVMGGGRRAESDESPADLQTEIVVDFREAARGAEHALSFDRPKACVRCEGTGISGGRAAQAKCATCGGSGRKTGGPFGFPMPCPACGGSGRLSGPPCTACHGSGTRPDRAHLKIRIPAGIEDGKTIRLAGQGAPRRGGGPPGDLFVKVRVQTDSHFRRDGKDLRLELPVTIGEAMLGTKIDVPTLDGSVTVSIPAGSQSGRSLRLRGKGIGPKGEAAGDLYVDLKVVLPDGAHGEDVKHAVKVLEASYRKPVR